jgi:hypothetical protein
MLLLFLMLLLMLLLLLVLLLFLLELLLMMLLLVILPLTLSLMLMLLLLLVLLAAEAATGMVRRLCAGLAGESASQIVALHGKRNTSVAATLPHNAAAAVTGLARRPYRLTRWCQQMMDAPVFVANAVAEGIDHCAPAGRRLLLPLLQANSAIRLSKVVLDNAYRYMCFCLEGLGAGGVLAQCHKRALVHQGRPQKAFLVNDGSIKRSFMTRLPPKLVLGKAQAFMEVWVGEHVRCGLPAVAGTISGMWLFRWRCCYGFTFGNPTANGPFIAMCSRDVWRQHVSTCAG